MGYLLPLGGLVDGSLVGREGLTTDEVYYFTQSLSY